jgi:hypothetical protein
MGTRNPHAYREQQPTEQLNGRNHERIAGLVALGVIAAFTFGLDGPLGGFWRPLEGAEQPTGLMIPGILG